MQIDGRKLDRRALERIRMLAVRRVQEGETASAVMRSYGLQRTSIYPWLRAFRRRGEEALRARKATGRPRRLTLRQEQAARRWINGRDPRQYGFDFGLWTRQLVAALVEERFGVTLSIVSVGRLLWRLGISPQKPLRRAYERDPEAVERWMKKEYPEIRKRASRRGAAIFFLDEAGIRSDATMGRTWSARGRTPVILTSGRRQAVNAISAVNPKGAFWYRVLSGRLNAGSFLQFLRHFLNGRKSPVFLIVDKHPSHTAAAVRDFVQSAQGRLEIHFLPGYSPDLNPDEFV